MRPGTRAIPAADIVIVNWNAGRHLRECLRSIVRTDRSLLRVARIVVVDNASTDSSLNELTAGDIPLDVVRNSHNRGFATACNQGAARGYSDFLLFLNPDTQLYPDTLRAVGGLLGTPAAEGVGIWGGRMVDERGEPAISCSRFPSLRIFFGKMTGLDRLAPALFPPHHLLPAETTVSGPVDQVIGAFFLLRRSLFEELGGFDERYFLYFEETDLALRARRRGRRSYYVHQARVHHIGQVSSAQLGGRRLRHSLCSRTRYAFRYWSRSHAWLLVALTLTVELATRLGRAVLRRSLSECGATLGGYGGYLRWLCTVAAHVLERRFLQATTTSPTPAPPAVSARTTDSTKDHLHASH
ncbi:glycosyltransferase family 2 protein [Streptomyces neyagawaensis]|uniref:glycosyltransferase family 2 protein n=1 Tax=Streptomyces neyagawaensis TaxID=42238 RepID=UPI0006E33D3A|nr:glycosyltransferase family 2 protein [Streptomyces neyagawaensis]MCL6738329.1 glycosyltransferase family 2 protein [Streptomyces neyagawaensis]MDE1688162.1 glycosyltransferase family 2 protein [Streptomyces neyagawaensis]